MNFELENHRPLREIVYQELKKRIVEGAIPPGTRMMEVELADALKVSRTPIREAIRKLEDEGLVTIEPRRGAYASKISLEDIIDVLCVREDLEGLAAELAAERITDEQVEELERITDRYNEAIQSADTRKIINFDEDFHKAIVAISGNKTLISFTSTVQELVRRFRYLYYDDMNRYVHMPQEHRHIIAALKSHDAQKSRQTADAHVSLLKEFVREEGASALRMI